MDKEKKLAEYKLFITSEPKIEKIDYGNLYIEWDVEKNLAEGKKIEDLIDKYAVEFNMGSKKLINKYAEEFNIEIKRGDEKKIAELRKRVGLSKTSTENKKQMAHEIRPHEAS